MSGAERQEGAGGALRVDGLQDGGRVNNTQLIAPFSSFMPKKEEGKKPEYCHQVATDQTKLAQTCRTPKYPGFLHDAFKYRWHTLFPIRPVAQHVQLAHCQ